MMKNIYHIFFCMSILLLCSYGAKADNGNENFCFDADVPEAQMDLSAMCLTAPVLFCPPTYLGCPSDNVDPTNTGFPTAMPGDPSCPTPVVSFTDQIVSNTSCLKIIHRTWEASYPPGSASIKLHSTCQQTLYLEDNTVPTIINCPSDLTLDLSVSCDSTATWVVPTAEDECGIQYFITTHFSGTSFSSGTTPVVYTASDQCGNETTCEFDVTVTGSCCNAPTISCPAAATVCPGADFSPATTGSATATMATTNCTSPTINFTDTTISTGSCAGAFVIQRAWTATVPSGSDSCTQQITSADNNNPIVTNGPSAIQLSATGNNCSAIGTWAEPTITDNCTATVTSTHSSGTSFPEGMTTVTYTAVDNCGNVATYAFNVTVTCICSTAPIITCPANLNLCLGSNTTPSFTGVATAIAGDPSCGTPAINFTDVIATPTGGCTGATIISRTWSASVTNNNSLLTNCVQTINVNDTSAPVISNVPQNISVLGTGASCSAIVTWSEPVASDNCGVINLVSTQSSGSAFVEGTTTVTYTAADACGNTSTASFTVTVACACNSVPQITCPSNINACVGGGTTPSSTGFATAIAGDPNCGTPTITFTDVNNLPGGSCAGAAAITRTWTASDPNNSNLVSSCTQTINLNDNTAPVITNAPQNISVLGTGTSCSAIVTWPEPVASDNCGVITLVSTQSSGSLFAQGTTTVTYTAADACGLTSSVSFTVTVDCACNSAPAITCPTNYTSCPGSTDPSVTGSATAVATDANCGTPTLSYNDQIISSGNCAGEQTIQRTWTATDAGSGLTSNCVQTLTLQDDGAAPTLTNIPTDLTVHGSGTNCNVLVKWADPVAADGCGVANLTSTAQSGDAFSEGTTSVTYTATDACGNSTNASFNVTVLCAEGCNTPPVISCPNSYASCAGGSIPSPSIAGVANATPGAVGCGEPFVFYSDMITAFGTCNGAYTIQRSWTAFDLSSAQLSTCVQTIELGDNSSPVFSNVPGNLTLNGTGTNCSATATWAIPTATDDCGINTIVSDYHSGDVFPQGTTTVTYTATDNCNNVTTVSFTVNVQCLAPTCSMPPTISCPANYNACPGAGVTDPSITGQAVATPSDVACSNPIVTYSDLLVNGSNSCTGAGTYNRTWVANDPNNVNLSASCVQTITLQDNANPVISNLPSNINLEVDGENCQSIATWSAPSATDDCGIASLTSNFTSGSTFGQGTTTVTYTAMDNCGKVTTGSFTVTVNCINTTCSTPPVISCPPNYTACATGTVPNVLETGFAFGIINGNNCSGTPYTTYSDAVVNSGPCAGAQVIERTWITTDPANKLQSSCIQTITLADNSLPVITNIPNNIVVTGSGFGCQVPVTWSEPTASDNCGLASLSSNIGSGLTFSSGTTTIVYTAVDNCGNIATASFTVTVQCEGCNTPPTITCPAAYTTCINGNIEPLNAGSATGAISGPNCSGAPYISHVDNVISSGPCTGSQVIERMWMATDPTSNLAANCTQTITLQDSTQPIISSVPGNIIVTGIGSGCQVPVTWNAPVASDDCGIDYVTSSNTNGSNFSEGTTTVTYTAVDLCGNFSTASFTVTVNCEECTTPPSISCPSNYVACIGSSTTPSFTGVATGTPGTNCTETPFITFTDAQISSGPCAGAQVIERTWLAYDPNSALTTSCIQTISIGDNTTPVIHNLPSNIVLTGNGSGCHVVATWTIPTASDNCGTPTISSNYPSGYSFAEGVTTVTYTAIDNCGNQAVGSFTVTVQCAGCNTAPTISCPTNYVACANTNNNPSVTGYAWASNSGANCSSTPNVSFSDLIVSTGPCFGSKEIERTWTATDPSSGLSTSCVQWISLGDNTPPTITNMPNNIIVSGTNSNCQVPVTWTAPNAFDNCSTATLTSNYPIGSVFNQGQTTVTYTATDACGNQSFATFIVTVQCVGCNTPPVVSCPPNYTACPSASTSPTQTGFATAYNNGANCSSTPSVTYSNQVIPSGSCIGAQTVTRTWTATDPSSGLNASCTQNISLKDNTPPSISNVPADLTISGTGPNCTAIATWAALTTTDNCGASTYTCDYPSGSAFNQGVTTVTCTATDNCGNQSTATFTVTVECEVCGAAPLITCPDNYTACPDESIPGTAITGMATFVAGEAACATPVLTFTDLLVSVGPCVNEKVIQRTFTAADPQNSNLSASCVQTIELIDTEAPLITSCPVGIILVGSDMSGGNGTGSGTGSGTMGGPGTGTMCAAVATWTIPTITDNCSATTLVATDQYGNVVTSGDIFTEGTTTITYTATDNCGNIATCSFDIIVSCSTVCDIAPIAVCPADVTVCVGSDISPSITGQATYIASPLCIDIVVTNTDSLLATGACSGEATIERLFLVDLQQGIGYQDSCTQIITMENMVPTLGACPADITVVGASTPVTWIAPAVTDACGTATLTSTQNSGNTFPCGLTTVTYTLTDACGIEGQCNFDVQVDCTSGNSGFNNCPPNMTVACGDPANWTAPTYTTSCTTCTIGSPITGFIYMGNFNGSHYYCSTAPATWPTAKTVCEANGGFLADVNSLEENEFIADQLSISSAWIGLTDVNAEGQFEWCNGQPVGYTNWYPGQPNNFNNSQDYVEMLSTGEWNDQYNHYALEYILEIPCTTIMQSSGPAPGSVNPPGTYTVTYTVNDPCGSMETCSFDITVEACNTAPCASSGLISTFGYIDQCIFGNINNTSGDDGGYGDYTSMCTEIEPGLFVPIEFHPGYGGGKTHTMYWTCWIDFNQDGDFDDNLEFVAYGAGAGTITGGITIPAGIPNGSCAMRVISKLGGYATDPCGTYLYGETEDYCINVVNGTLKGDDTGNKSASVINEPIELTALVTEIVDEVIEVEIITESLDTSNEEVFVTETNQDSKPLEVRIYPNPVSQVMNLEINDVADVTAIGLYDQSGRELRSIEIAKRSRTDVSNLGGGMYIIRILRNDGTIETEKVIIMN